jgi:hypothetical protein
MSGTKSQFLQSQTYQEVFQASAEHRRKEARMFVYASGIILGLSLLALQSVRDALFKGIVALALALVWGWSALNLTGIIDFFAQRPVALYSFTMISTLFVWQFCGVRQEILASIAKRYLENGVPERAELEGVQAWSRSNVKGFHTARWVIVGLMAACFLVIIAPALPGTRAEFLFLPTLLGGFALLFSMLFVGFYSTQEEPDFSIGSQLLRHKLKSSVPLRAHDGCVQDLETARTWLLGAEGLTYLEELVSLGLLVPKTPESRAAVERAIYSSVHYHSEFESECKAMRKVVKNVFDSLSSTAREGND